MAIKVISGEEKHFKKLNLKLQKANELLKIENIELKAENEKLNEANIKLEKKNAELNCSLEKLGECIKLTPEELKNKLDKDTELAKNIEILKPFLNHCSSVFSILKQGE